MVRKNLLNEKRKTNDVDQSIVDNIDSLMDAKENLPSEIPQKERDNFLMVFGGHILFQTLYSAVEFDLFTKLWESKQLRLSEICEQLKVEKQPARILLLGLVNTGLLNRSVDGIYSNTSIADILLVKHSPKNLISYVKTQHHVMYKGMFHFHESLKAFNNLGLEELEGDEPTLYQRLGHNPKVKQIFQDAMHELSEYANNDLAENVDFSNVKNLVDVGGGDGTNVIALAKNYSNLKAAVFDLPSVCPIAEKKIKTSGYQERLNVIPGNCFQDKFPAADCFLFSHFCTIWSEAKNKILFKKAYEALPKNGKVVVFNMMQNNDESGPLTAALGSPYFLTVATGEGMLYTWGEYEKWMKESGFREVKAIKLAQDHGAIIGIK
jgi:ubiquinone/menaquinone biosynthesis C-methylase UbiE